MIFTDIVGIIADDLTGANDTALQFHLRGANTRILLDGEYIPQKMKKQKYGHYQLNQETLMNGKLLKKLNGLLNLFLKTSRLSTITKNRFHTKRAYCIRNSYYA